MWQDHGAHAYRNALGPLDKDYRNLGREHQWLLGPAVVAVYVGSQLRVVEDLLCKRQEAAFYVPAGSSGLACKDVAVVSLLLYEQVAVGQFDQRSVDGGIAVWVVLHGLAHNVGHLVELAVVHGDKGMEYTPLHRLEAVHQIRDCAVADYIGGILQEIIFIKLRYLCHITPPPAAGTA